MIPKIPSIRFAENSPTIRGERVSTAPFLLGYALYVPGRLLVAGRWTALENLDPWILVITGINHIWFHAVIPVISKIFRIFFEDCGAVVADRAGWRRRRSVCHNR